MTNRLAFATALGLSLAIIGSAEGTSSTGVAVVAAGSAGSWGTVVELANPGDDELTGRYYSGDFECIDPSGLLCRTALYDIPPRSTAEIRFEGPDVEGLKMLAITLVPSGIAAFPTVRAFARNGSTGSVNEILASSFVSIMNRPAPAVLAFPGIPIEAGSHVNVALLAVADLAAQPFGPRSVGFSARLELLEQTGAVIGETTVSGCGGSGLCGDVFVTDLARVMHLGDLSYPSATLRVTQLSGEGALWGQAVVVNAEGFVTTVAGFTP